MKTASTSASVVALSLLLGRGVRCMRRRRAFDRGQASINLIIGYPPAGANDVYARLAARHLGKHIPGNPSVVRATCRAPAA